MMTGQEKRAPGTHHTATRGHDAASRAQDPPAYGRIHLGHPGTQTIRSERRSHGIRVIDAVARAGEKKHVRWVKRVHRTRRLGMDVEVKSWTGKEEERLEEEERTTMPKVKPCPCSDIILTIAAANAFSYFMSLSSSPDIFASARLESKSAEVYVVPCTSFFTPAKLIWTLKMKKRGRCSASCGILR